MQHIKLVAILVISFVIICINTHARQPSRKQVYRQYYKKAYPTNKMEKYVNKPIYPTVYTPEISDYFSSNARVYRAYNFDDFDYLPQESKITPNKLKLKPDTSNGGFAYPYDPAAQPDNVAQESKITPDRLPAKPDNSNREQVYPSQQPPHDNPKNDENNNFHEETIVTSQSDSKTSPEENENPDHGNGEYEYPNEPAEHSDQLTDSHLENEENAHYNEESKTAPDEMNENHDNDNGDYGYLPADRTVVEHEEHSENEGHDSYPQESKITPDQLQPQHDKENVPMTDNEGNSVNVYDIKKKPHKKGDKKTPKKEEEDCEEEVVPANRGPSPGTTIFDKLAMLTDCIPLAALNSCPQTLQPVCAISNGFMQVFANECTFRMAKNERPLEEFIQISEDCCLVFWRYCTAPQLNIM